VAALSGNVDQENSWHNEIIAVDSSYLTSNFRLRFRGTTSTFDEDANVDNVRLVATSLAPPPSALPIADAGGPYSGSEGGGVLLDGSASFDPDGTITSYAWDLDNDGQYDDAAGATASFNSIVDGVFTVGLRVTDNSGGMSTDTATVTIANVGPTAEAGGPYAGNEGSNISLSAAASSDPGPGHRQLCLGL
jgi:hypothetical protein